MTVQESTPRQTFFEYWDKLHSTANHAAAEDESSALNERNGGGRYPGLSALLDPQESNSQMEGDLSFPSPYSHNGQDLQASFLEQRFRHSGWKATRQRLWLIMTGGIQTEEGERLPIVSNARLARFANCGACATLQHSVDQDLNSRIRIAAEYCHDRFCVPCSNAKARVIQNNLVNRLAKVTRVRFITLTLKATDRPLREQIDKLLKAFLDLRRRKFWKNHNDGGAAFLEVKIGAGSGLWHPHLHIIAEGEFMLVSNLSEEWKEVTKDSHRVHIRAADSMENVARYCTKYVTKLAPLSELNDNQLTELVASCGGLHSCYTYGTWRGWKLTKRPPDNCHWIDLGKIESIFEQNQRGEPGAAAIVTLIGEHYPLLREMFDAHRSANPPPANNALS